MAKKRKKKTTKKAVSKKAVEKTVSIKEISWRAPEWAHHSKGIVWWMSFFLVFCALLAIFYYFSFWWGIIFVILFAAVIFNHSFRKPREILCKIDNKGVKIGTRFFEWEEMISFWFVPDMPYTLLYIRTTNKILSIISIEVPINKAEAIFQLLSKHLAIEDEGEIFVDRLTRITRF